MKKNSSNIFWLLLLAVGVVIVWPRLFPRDEAVTPLPLPPLMAEGWINAASAPSLDQLRGKLVVLDAWATWCGPCRQELPGLIKFNQQLGDQVVLVGLTSERGGEAATVREFVSERDGMDWPIGYGAQPVFDALGTPGFPTYYLFGRDGMLLWQGHSVNGLEAQVVKALGQAGA